MVSLQYKGRIHRSKFSMRSVRYILSDQAARLLPPLQRRWLFPVEAIPVEQAAVEDVAFPSVLIDAPLPASMKSIGVGHPPPLQLTDHVYTLNDVVVTGWAGAMIKDGVLLAVRPNHNWPSTLRARPHRLKVLPKRQTFFNLMAPVPARGHIFHWLFNSILPLLAYLQGAGRAHGLGLIVNAGPSEFQRRTFDYLRHRYGIATIETLGRHEAAQVDRLLAAIPVPHIPRALQCPEALAQLDDLAAFIIHDEPTTETPKKLYISRNDARLRRVLNETQLLPLLASKGFEAITLRGLAFARQVRLFRNAEFIIGPHGAGLAHIAWCKPETRMTEFFPSPHGPRGPVRNASGDYWLISQLRALRHRACVAGPIENRLDGFRIDPELLKDVVS